MSVGSVLLGPEDELAKQEDEQDEDGNNCPGPAAPFRPVDYKRAELPVWILVCPVTDEVDGKNRHGECDGKPSKIPHYGLPFPGISVTEPYENYII